MSISDGFILRFSMLPNTRLNSPEVIHTGTSFRYISTTDQWADMLTKTHVPLNIEQLYLGRGDTTSQGSVENLEVSHL